MMVSSRTEYREKRIDLITMTIGIMSKWLLLYKQDLEKLNLPRLKQINDEVLILDNHVKKFSTGSKN